MIRIELDRIHLELLLLSGLVAAFAGIVFEPIRQYGMNMIPLVAFGSIGMIGLIVLIHRRVTTGDRNRVRAMVWLALVGAFLGATVSSVLGNSVRSMALAAIGVGTMFFALGTQFSIVIKSREAAARDALEEIIDEENVFVASEQARTNGAMDRQQSNFKSTESTRASEASAFSSNDRNESDESDEATTSRSKRDDTESERDDTESERKAEANDETDEVTESNDEQTDASEDRCDVEQTDDPGSEHWAQSTADDAGPIPVIRSITSTESSEE